MDILQKIAEERIREAIENGVFDNLPGKGRFIDLSDYFRVPPHLRMAYSLLKNAGYIPVEIELKKEIEMLKEKWRCCTDEEEKRRLGREINEKSVKLSLILERYRRHR
ncbi:MAG: DUF1992 domain-containing protein [Calditrichaeota bacterium]|nr:MAG: DUF1992 domain-containing protein [Calditrichota bacterium]